VTKREAKRLARMTLVDEMRRTIDCTDELASHPETNVKYTPKESVMIFAAAEEAYTMLEKVWIK